MIDSVTKALETRPAQSQLSTAAPLYSSTRLASGSGKFPACSGGAAIATAATAVRCRRCAACAVLLAARFSFGSSPSSLAVSELWLRSRRLDSDDVQSPWRCDPR